MILPPLLEARKRHFLTAKNIFQLSTQSGFEMQSSMIDVMIPDHGILNFTGDISVRRKIFTEISFRIW